MEHHWYKNIIVYTVDVKSFSDSNGDGIGDLPGLISKLDYFSDLGVTCIWLLPFYPSPCRDNGYDVIDHFSVDPRLGTIEDFQIFVRKAGERGIHVMIDLIMNHTSDQHPWFLAARNDAHSIFRDYYVWAKVPPPQDPSDKPAFPDTESGVWKFDEVAGDFYYHKFYHFQPDLQVAYPEVQDEIKKVLDYWLSMGVSGFRVDAVPIMVKKKGLERTKPLNPHKLLQDMRKFVGHRREGAVLMGEADVDGPELIDYFADGTGLQLVFNFLLNAFLIGAIVEEKAETLVRGWRELPIIPDSGNWLNFLRNLDELNINQLPPRQRELVFKKLAPLSEMRIYQRGIRRRLASMLEGNQKQIEMAYSLLFSLPGTPMFVYGDEIGMGDNLELFERESVRTPMQWNDKSCGGFSHAPEEKLYRPMVQDEKFHFSKINVEKQKTNEHSLFKKIQELISARKNHPEIGFGKLVWVGANHPSVIGHICHWKNDMLLAVHNLSSSDLQVTLDLKTVFAKRLKIVLGECEVERLVNGHYQMKLKGHDYVWFSVHYERDE